MDVDRISQMTGVRREATPVWPKSARQRRKPAPTQPTVGDLEEENPGAESEAAEAQVEDEAEPEEEAEPTGGSRINLMA